MRIVKHWLVNAQFNRYIIGRPNLLYIPIKMSYNKKNMYLNKGSDIIFKMKGIWVSFHHCYLLDRSIVTIAIIQPALKLILKM
jgi:hypothetical protein